MRKFRWSWGVLGAAVAVANGCGGQSVERITADGSGATGGGTGVGGAAGRGVGAGGTAGHGAAGAGGAGRGAAGRGSAGRGVAGTATAAGRNASGGDAGGDVGGSTTIGGAGSSTDDPSVIPSNGDCHCVLNFDGWFSCTTSLDNDAVSKHAGAVCDQPDTLTTRVPCDDGGFAYHWVEGGENDYDLSVDANGQPTYYSAFGYVGAGCGVPSEYQLGTIVAGTQSSSCFGEYTCAACTDDVTDVPSCPACTRSIDDPGEVTMSLVDYCASNSCPASADAARAYLTTSCDMYPRATLSRACGRVILRREVGFGIVFFAYDEVSGDLVGVFEQQDLPHGPCNAVGYVAGSPFNENCTTSTSCEFCASSGNGAAGEAGSSSATDACLP